MNIIFSSIFKRLYSRYSLLSNIYKSGIVFIFLTFFIKIISFYKEILVAQNFGTSRELEIFLFALISSSFLLNMVAFSFVPAYMPRYIELDKSNSWESRKLLEDVLSTATYVILLVIFIMAFLGYALIFKLVNTFSYEQKILCYKMYIALLPLLFVDGLGNIYTSILEAKKQFKLSAIVPIFKPIVLIVLLLTVSSINVWTLVCGWIFGSVLVFIFVVFTLKSKQLFVLPSLNFKLDNARRKILNQYWPIALGAIFTSVVPLIDQYMASNLQPGTLAGLDYGNKLTTIFIGLGSPVLASVVLPYFSEFVSSKDWHSFTKYSKRILMMIFFASFCICIVSFFFGELFTSLVFERGLFTQKDSLFVSKAFWFYLLQLPFYFGVFLFAKLISALQKNEYLFIGAFFTLFFNVIFNLVLIKYFGGLGIAISTSVSYMLLFFIYLRILNNLLKKAKNENFG